MRLIPLAPLMILISASVSASEVTPRIAWYGTLATARAEAVRTDRPILLVSAAPHCLGVPGVW
ncbi:MAG: hypothetical protein GY768_12975 [Planctomycetaceae bacterium]|nr:hypothetical protein [Planctomycetaceae bacterium]